MRHITLLRHRTLSTNHNVHVTSFMSFRRYRRILGHFDPSVGTEIILPPSGEEQKASIPIIGFSATFGRHDGLSLGSVFEEIVYHRDFLQMIKEQW